MTQESPIPAPKRLWLIVNPASGGFEPGIVELLCETARRGRAKPGKVTHFPETPLPTARDLEAADTDLLVVFSGDGTINAAAHAATGWPGSILVLPGGTMNVLSRRLHGEKSLEVILDRALAGESTIRPLTRIEAVDGHPSCAHVGIFAGPPTSWGEVREDLRYRDLSALVEDIPRAISETLTGAPVSLEARGTEYRTLFIEPGPEGLHAIGFTTTGPLSLLEHARAWIEGDFREGPHDDLGWHRQLSLHSDGMLGLLVDGEPAEAPAPLRLRAATSPVNFIFTRQP